jgi:hypothetical protein
VEGRKMDRGRRNHFIKRPNGAIKKMSAIHFHCIAAHKTPAVLIHEFPQSQIRSSNVNKDEKREKRTAHASLMGFVQDLEVEKIPRSTANDSHIT